MDPLQNKIHFPGINLKLIPMLLILAACVITFTTLEATAQSIDDGYNLRVRTEPNIFFIGGGGFYDPGTIVTLDEAPQRWGDYSFTGWKIDGKWADGNPITIRMDNPHSAVAVYTKDIGGSIIVDSIPRISEITVDGTIYLPDELPLSFSWPEGSTHIISAPSFIKENTETRYVFDSWKDKNTESDRTITIGPETQEIIALFKTQHYIKPITEFGNVVGGGWHDEGKAISFELESDIVIDKKDENIRYVFESWDLGDYQNLPTNTIDVDEATTVSANWDKEYFVKLTTSIPDYDIFGTGWYTEDKKLALIVEEELESPASDIKYVFDKWISRGPNPVIIPNSLSPATTITVTEPYVIEAQYKESYLVSVWTQFGDAIGAGYYPQGEIAEISLSQNEIVVEPTKVRKVFSGWDTQGAKTMDFGGDTESDVVGVQNLLVSVQKPETIRATWNTQYFLDVQSTEGKTRGSGWYDVGRVVPISVDTRSTPPGMWSISIFDRWTGDISSSDINERVVMNEPKTIIAEYKQDNTPGIMNSFILAAIGGIGLFVYTKTQKPKLNFKFKSRKNQYQEKDLNPFEHYRDNPFESDVQIPRGRPKKSAVMDWLMGR